MIANYGILPLFTLCTYTLLCVTRVISAESADESVYKESCKLFYFYDRATDHCEPCSGMCQLPKQERTEQFCNDSCPDYMRSQSCLTEFEEFFDEEGLLCRRCSDICNPQEPRNDSVQMCKTKCPEYTRKSSDSSHDIMIIAGVLMAVLIVCIGSGFICCNRTRRNAYKKFGERDIEAAEGVQETNDDIISQTAPEPVTEINPNVPSELVC